MSATHAFEPCLGQRQRAVASLPTVAAAHGAAHAARAGRPAPSAHEHDQLPQRLGTKHGAPHDSTLLLYVGSTHYGSTFYYGSTYHGATY
eukprot:scaffold27377_cov61-Phaeocystis_antarctica.AAC.5